MTTVSDSFSCDAEVCLESAMLCMFRSEYVMHEAVSILLYYCNHKKMVYLERNPVKTSKLSQLTTSLY
jgi:hypothetical protein